ncbi:MAG TPA: competence/damage-inducible protein A [Candidatus Acidoferrales bacterium]|nr:competence/damage-inducible protein A [Candidatus Acidoferrales bacterium]
MKQAEIIAVGSELLTPHRLDTNSLFLTEELNRLGVNVVRKTVVGDDRQRLREAFRQALERADLVISTGGLGPTEDDLTREAVAELLARKLVPDERVLEHIRERFARLGRTMTPNNERQALVPEGALVLANDAGTAPGLWLEAGDRVLVLLPGPPREARAVFAAHVRALVDRRSGPERMRSRWLRTTGLTESEVDHRIAAIYRSAPGVETTILSSHGEIEIHLRLWSAEADAADGVLEELTGKIAQALGEAVFSTRGESIEEVVARELQLAGATIAVAESCTGGLVSERLTTLPGSSLFFRGGIVSYSNDLKTAWVNVPAELIAQHGAVSAEVALAMAEGVRRSADATLGVGITGIAGPGGGTPEKPVGTVHVSLADATSGRERGLRLGGDRERIRQMASQIALDMVRRHLWRVRRGRG